MSKGISPLIAGVLLIAFVLAVAAIISGWLTSMTRKETATIETGFTTTVNCSKGVIDIVDVIGGTDSSIAIQNSGFVDLTGKFSVSCGTDTFTTATDVSLSEGEMATITVTGVDCTGDKVRITSQRCPSVWAECTDGETC